MFIYTGYIQMPLNPSVYVVGKSATYYGLGDRSTLERHGLSGNAAISSDRCVVRHR